MFALMEGAPGKEPGVVTGYRVLARDRTLHLIEGWGKVAAYPGWGALPVVGTRADSGNRRKTEPRLQAREEQLRGRFRGEFRRMDRGYHRYPHQPHPGCRGDVRYRAPGDYLHKPELAGHCGDLFPSGAALHEQTQFVETVFLTSPQGNPGSSH